MTTATMSARNAEIKSRSTEQVKADATRVYARWGLSLSDAINVFLIKSIEVGGLPFDMRPGMPSYETLAAGAYKAQINAEGIAVLPSEWDDDE